VGVPTLTAQAIGGHGRELVARGSEALDAHDDLRDHHAASPPRRESPSGVPPTTWNIATDPE
jgi:hypothetical protein